MKALITGLAIAASTAPANAVIVQGRFEGIVTSGSAQGNYGYAYDSGAVDITGQRISGTISYDTVALGAPCSSTQVWQGTAYFGCFFSDSGMTITHTINGYTETFAGSPSNQQGLQYNLGRSGLLLYNLTDNALNAATLSMIGTPATVYTQHQTSLAVLLDPGAITDARDNVITYTGSAADGPFNYVMNGMAFNFNDAAIYQLTGGYYTMATTYSFTLTSFNLAPAVPEPASWALMIAGFGLAGGVIRRRRQAVLT